MAFSVGFDIFARDRASQVFDKVGNKIDQAGAKSKRFNIAAAAAVTAVTTALLKFGKDSVSAFVDAEASQRKLTDAYRRFPALADVSIDKMRDLGAAIQAKTKFDADDVAASQAVLAQYKLTGAQIASLTPLLADYAQKTGKDIPDAAKDLGMAILGKGKALAAVGIKFKDAGSAEANFTQLTKGLRAQVGGFADGEGKSLEGRMAILGNKFGDMQEKVGEALVPVLEQLVDVGSSVIGWAVRNSTALKRLGIGVGILTVAIMAGKVAIAAHGIAMAVTAAGGLKAFMLGTKAAAAAQWLMNAALSANPIGVVIILIAALAAGLVYAWKNSEGFRRAVTTAFEAIASAARWMWNNVLQPVIQFILRGFAAVASKIASVLDALGDIPGFGWAKDAARMMQTAADKADALANKINKIPDHKNVTVNVRGRVTSGRLTVNGEKVNIGMFAAGGRPPTGRLSIVGERGPEFFVPDEPGTVVDAETTKAIMRGGRRGIGNPANFGGGGGMSVQIVINGVTDKVGAAREVAKALRELERSTGRPIGLIGQPPGAPA